MLSRLFPAFEVHAFGISLTVYSGDVELNVGRYGITALWGDAAFASGLFIRSRDWERHYEWPF
ncbi:hypothetical protein ASF28_08735 [Methylobacterium sp. Leaf99]|uniref:hypothetical protein n=1 Tax=Methylobacterium sp. Leaf99 TaxID=1736251 RepID=UPI0006FAD017|nr:hypothetical protein [Methylobacterium sp. Leaf99]KQP11124.1 hypothetical protein ASF28_08735 [Methylobacterium sp. Leaf99]